MKGALRNKLKSCRTIKSFYDAFRIWSVWEALKEQNLASTLIQLEVIVPNIDDQYSEAEVKSNYIRMKIRALHSFQIGMVAQLIRKLKKVPQTLNALASEDVLRVLDVGDSSGNHSLYLKGLFSDIETVSVNIDQRAVEKIKGKGLKAYWLDITQSKLPEKDIDLIMLFEMLEHIENPIEFLRKLKELKPKFLILTVPFLRKSRIGMHHIRQSNKEMKPSPESVHVFELCPEDWKLLFAYAGWKVVEEKTYLQYPLWLPFLSWFWKRTDFEGFWGVVLEDKR